MSVTGPETNAIHLKGRKRDPTEAELEIDVDAPEPPSKKALRKAKKAKLSTSNTSPVPKKESGNPSAGTDEFEGKTKRSEHGIWIGNLSFGTTKEDLLKFLTITATKVLQPDSITRVHLPLGPPKFGKPQNKGFAYVDFCDQKCVETALASSESMLAGRRVLIKDAKNFEGRPEQKNDKEGKPSHPPSRRIFVGNLDFATTVEDLEAHFDVCGTITSTHMATFEDSGKCKGYAWIEFEQVASAEKAMRGWVEPDGKAKDSAPKSRSGNSRIWVNKIHGRKLRMEYAEDKAVRYEKRFGKNAKMATSRQQESTAQPGIVEVDGDEVSHVVSVTKAKKPKPEGKYSEETVQKLTGAIVESRGQRTLFE
jgi:RNA recognition motif-containing protein